MTNTENTPEPTQPPTIDEGSRLIVPPAIAAQWRRLQDATPADATAGRESRRTSRARTLGLAVPAGALIISTLLPWIYQNTLTGLTHAIVVACGGGCGGTDTTFGISLLFGWVCLIAGGVILWRGGLRPRLVAFAAGASLLSCLVTLVTVLSASAGDGYSLGVGLVIAIVCSCIILVANALTAR
ncbi:MAG: hypothetical protein ABSG43_01065 [Solirubrobacteraceae bacterium]|jgi:hypothetical protein